MASRKRYPSSGAAAAAATAGDDVLELNAGGRIFVTSRLTLRTEQRSMMAQLFDSSSPFDTTMRKGRPFIGRNGDTFANVLGTCAAPADSSGSMQRTRAFCSHQGRSGVLRPERAGRAGRRAAGAGENGGGRPE